MIKLENVSVSFGNQRVLGDLSFEFGGVTAVTGASGSGKTTLLRVLLGLQKIDAGSVSGQKGKSTAAVFQDDRLIPSLGAAGNVALVLPKKFPRSEIKKHLALVGLEGEDIVKPALELSGGMRRRVAVVRAVLFGADVTVMDEPFKGLDDETRRRTIEYVKEYTKSGVLVFSTHDRSDVSALGAEELKIV